MDDIEPVFERLERNLPLRDRTRGGKHRDVGAAAAVTTLTAAEEPTVKVDLSDPDRPVIDLTELNEELASAADLSSAPAGSAAEARVAATAAAPETGDAHETGGITASSASPYRSAPPIAGDDARDATAPGRPGRLGRLIVAGAAVVVAARLLRRRR